MLKDYKEAITKSPDKTRQILARAMQDSETTVEDIDALVEFADAQTLDDKVKNWYSVRAHNIAKLDTRTCHSMALGTLEGILKYPLSPEEAVARQRYFLAQLDKAVKEAQR